MAKKQGDSGHHTVEERWWHFAIVGAVLTLVAAAVFGSALVDGGAQPEAAVVQQAHGGATLIEVSAAPRN